MPDSPSAGRLLDRGSGETYGGRDRLSGGAQRLAGLRCRPPPVAAALDGSRTSKVPVNPAAVQSDPRAGAGVAHRIAFQVEREEPVENREDEGWGVGVEDLIRALLRELGENPEREGLLETPARVARAWRFLSAGYRTDPDGVVRKALFAAESQEMVVVNDIDFYSMCEHHMLPFFGKAHIAYIPDGQIVGLSKIARVVEIYARRLQVQERMTAQIARCLYKNLGAQGVGVVLHAQHLCMMMRGVQKQNSFAVTSEMLGTFRDNARTRSEFLTLIQEKAWN
jgi:GTP cyclohydrolase I